MKFAILGAIAGVLAPAATFAAPPDVHAATKALGRGINLGNALDAPNEGEWGVTLQPEYFAAIKKAGFDSVRLPVRWSNHAGKEAPYALDEKFARRVDWALARAEAAGLNVVLNVHHYDEIVEAPEAHLPRLEALWKQIAPRYRDRGPWLSFEILNEPHTKLTDEKWNAAIPPLLKIVRESNPTRPVVVGPGQWNSIRALDKLQLPDDPHLIVTFHYYDPFEFTHQKASWVKGSDKWAGRTWRGTAGELEKLRTDFAKVKAWADKNKRPVYLGEFGAFSAADDASRAAWTAAVAREAERNGFAWAYWEFCSGFGAYDPDANKWRPLLASLIPPVR